MKRLVEVDQKGHEPVRQTRDYFKAHRRKPWSTQECPSSFRLNRVLQWSLLTLADKWVPSSL